MRRSHEPAVEWTEEESRELLSLLGQKHVLTILWSLFRREPLRFHELQIGIGINPTSLTDRLRKLADQGLIERRVAHVIPRRVEYRLSRSARRGMSSFFRDLKRWRNNHLPEDR